MTKAPLIDRLRESAEWVQVNAIYHFDNDNNHGAYNNSQEAVEAIIDAIKLLENLSIGKPVFSNSGEDNANRA